MNNGFISLAGDTPEKPVEVTEKLRSEEGRLVKIIEAVRSVQQTEAWSTLKIEVFDSLTDKLERELKREAEEDDPDPSKLNRINGQLIWARKYSDLNKLEREKMVELQRIKHQLYGNTTE